MASPFGFFGFLYAPDDLLHILIVVLSILVLAISFLALSKRRNRRYLLLCVAFFFLALSQVVTLAETLFLSGALLTIPVVSIHVSHLFDFLMLLTFGLALVRDWDQGGRGVPHIGE